MRYFFYINGNQLTAVKVDENSDIVKLCPPERTIICSLFKSDWLSYYNGIPQHLKETSMFEICENQYKKFVEKGITPLCHDDYFVAQLKAKNIK